MGSERAMEVVATTLIDVPDTHEGGYFRAPIGPINADAILAALSAAGLTIEQDWRPIEEAPKDGTWVDLWGYEPGTNGRRYTKAKWHRHYSCWVTHQRTFQSDRFTFTHFRLLPKGPTP